MAKTLKSGTAFYFDVVVSDPDLEYLLLPHLLLIYCSFLVCIVSALLSVLAISLSVLYLNLYVL